MKRFGLVAAVVAVGVSAASFAIAAPLDSSLMEKWKSVGGRVGGKYADMTETWGTLRFAGTTVDFPRGRRLRYEVDQTVTPHRLKIWNEVGDTKVPVYSAIYLIKDGKLFITFNPGGDDYPTKLESAKGDTTTEVHFVKQ